MKDFTENFRKMIPGVLGQATQVTAGTSAATVLSAVNRYRSYLTTNSGKLDSFLGALSMDANLISDKFVDNAKVEYSDEEITATEISDDIAETLLGGVSDAIHNGEESIAQTGFTLTDSAGLMYNVIDQRSENVVIDGKKIIMSSSVYPNKLAESFIYQDVATSKYYLNNFIRTANFVKREAQRIEPDTVRGYLLSLCFMDFHVYYDDKDIKWLVNKMASGFANSIQQTLGIYYVATLHNVPTDTDLISMLHDLWSYYNETKYPIPTPHGCINSVWSVIKDSYESSQLNSFILRCSNAILGGFNKATEITTLVAEAIKSKFNAIIKFGKGIASAFNRGGVYGVACYILSYIKDLLSANSSADDGTLSFSDNSRYAPQIYIAGLISGIITAASAVISVLVSIFSKIIGAALSIVGSVITSIIKAFQFDYDGTYGAINTDEDVMIPITPYGMFQTTIPVSRIENEDLLSLLEQGENLIYADIPGGFVIMGSGSFDAKGKTTSLRVEFHPSIETSGEACPRLINYLFAKQLISSEIIYDQDQGLPIAKFSLNYPGADRAELLEEIASLWNEYRIDHLFSNNDRDRLSAEDDALMRENIARNIFIMGIFIGLACGYQSINEYNSFRIELVTVSEGYVTYTLTANAPQQCGIWYALTHYGSPRYVTYENRDYWFGSSSYHNQAAWISWKHIVDCIVLPLDDNTDVDAEELINEALYLDELVTFTSELKPIVLTPQYDQNSFWTVLISTIALTALAAGVIAVASFKVKKAITKRRSINEARVAQAYQNLQDEPSAANYEAYRKAVKKNNMWANFIGGSKFDLQSYWNGATNKDDGSSSGTVSNPFNVLPMFTDGQVNDGQTVAGMNSDTYGDQNLINLQLIKALIVGS